MQCLILFNLLDDARVRNSLDRYDEIKRVWLEEPTHELGVLYHMISRRGIEIPENHPLLKEVFLERLKGNFVAWER